jgi:hypothetical protein
MSHPAKKLQTGARGGTVRHAEEHTTLNRFFGVGNA